MLHNSPILKDYLLTDIFDDFFYKSDSLIQLGKDKYVANLAQRNKEINGRTSTNYNSDTDISITSIRSKHPKKSRTNMKSIRFNNDVNKTLHEFNDKDNNKGNNNNNTILKSQILCRNGENCRFLPNCAFFHSKDFINNIDPFLALFHNLLNANVIIVIPHLMMLLI